MKFMRDTGLGLGDFFSGTIEAAAVLGKLLQFYVPSVNPQFKRMVRSGNAATGDLFKFLASGNEC